MTEFVDCLTGPGKKNIGSNKNKERRLNERVCHDSLPLQVARAGDRAAKIADISSYQ
jgi:hypothetical protein